MRIITISNEMWDVTLDLDGLTWTAYYKGEVTYEEFRNVYWLPDGLKDMLATVFDDLRWYTHLEWEYNYGCISDIEITIGSTIYIMLEGNKMLKRARQ